MRDVVDSVDILRIHHFEMGDVVSHVDLRFHSEVRVSEVSNGDWQILQLPKMGLSVVGKPQAQESP